MLSVITNIGFDHKDLLGDTLTKIAVEKAGIIKDHVPVVVSERQPDVETVFIEKAKIHQAALKFASDEFVITQSSNSFEVIKNDSLFIGNLLLPLKGHYQTKNVAGVCKAVEVLQKQGLKITYANLIHGLENVVIQTRLKGRWQQLGTSPLIICDTGHNVDGIRELVVQILQQSYKNLFIVLGMVADKEPDEVLKLLPKNAYYYFCQARISRAMQATQLHTFASRFNLIGEVEPDVTQAMRKAIAKADKDDFIFIGGSTFVVAEIDTL